MENYLHLCQIAQTYGPVLKGGNRQEARLFDSQYILFDEAILKLPDAKYRLPSK